MTPLIVIPAAGASSRMRGRDKLMEQVEGEPLIRRQARRAAATGAEVIACLTRDETPRRAALAGLDVTILAVEDAAEGLGATLRAAARHVLRQPERAMAVLLPDAPGIGTADIEAVFAAFGQHPVSPVRATDPEGRPGTPLVVPARLVPAFAALRGDDGGKSALAGEKIRLVEFPDDRATRDLDTPEDWAAWRDRS